MVKSICIKEDNYNTTRKQVENNDTNIPPPEINGNDGQNPWKIVIKVIRRPVQCQNHLRILTTTRTKLIVVTLMVVITIALPFPIMTCVPSVPCIPMPNTSVENRNALQGNNDNASHASQISDRGGEHIPQQEENRFKCFHCNGFYSSDRERVAHIGAEHSCRFCYPNPEDFENLLNR